jgi:proteasome lid subunit RPN8/RPN11
MAFHLQIPRRFREAMILQARAELPNECCGLLAGHILPPVQAAEGVQTAPLAQAVVVERFPLVNEMASPKDFHSEPHSMLAAEKARRRLGLEFLAVYHSHPTAPPIPSRRDLERNYWGENVVCLIISLNGPEPEIRGWWLAADDYREAECEWIDDNLSP